MGSVPTVHIASEPLYNDIKGVILLSPIASGIKLINPNIKMSSSELEKIDCFCNIGKVSEIKCPIFLIHGKQDEVIPYEQSLEMMKKMKYVYEWFPQRGNHTNIISKYRSKFYSKVKLFLDHLNYTNKSKSKTHGEKSENISKVSINGLMKVTCEENYMFTTEDSKVNNKKESLENSK